MLQLLNKTIFSAELTFTNQRALFWKEKKTLILSDLHVGKSAHFRKHGIAISSEVLLADLKRLGELISYFKAEKIVIVGDLFHAGYNTDLDLFKEWRFRFSQEFILVAGNHDRLKAEQYTNLGISKIENKLDLAPFSFVHHPEKLVKNRFYICGHIHPGFVLEGKTERIKLPCFAVSDQQIVLPAFSKFTGLDTKSLKGNFTNIVFSEEFIIEV